MHAKRAGIALVAVLAGLVGCQGEVDPPSLVNRFRVLAVRAEPPELRPGETTTLDVLVADPYAPPEAPPPSFLWLACTAAPGASLEVCAALATRPPAADELPALSRCDATTSAAMAAGGTCLLGTTAAVTYRAPADLLASGEERREVVVLAVAAASDAMQCVLHLGQTGGLAPGCTVSLKRLVVSQSATPNRNPALDALRLDGVVLAEGASPAVASGEHVLEAAPAAEAAEEYPGDGGTDETERLLLSWYLAAPGSAGTERSPGKLALFRSEVAGQEQRWTAPREAGPVDFWVVVRDERGGVGWLRRSVTAAGR